VKISPAVAKMALEKPSSRWPNFHGFTIKPMKKIKVKQSRKKRMAVQAAHWMSPNSAVNDIAATATEDPDRINPIKCNFR